MIGAFVGILSSPLVGGSVTTLLAAFALASPWIQAVGRMRCLVQGCCHGAPTSPAAGIRYRHPRSRVCHIAEWTGVPLLPTPVFSMAGNLVIGVLLIRLRTLGAADLLLVGLFFMLTGIARFVEESYRGEPQTPRVAGLRIYQWFAVGTLLAGIAVTMLPADPVSGGIGAPTGRLLAWAAAFFVIAAAAMGLDFPGSDRRFSRLASTDRAVGPEGS
jgi:prolipoprotein diacylglyceryltransferase